MAEIKVEMTIYELVQKCRYELSKMKLEKSGLNKHLNFKYFELADFVPAAIQLFYENGLCPIFSIVYDSNGVETAVLKIVKGAEQITFSTPTDAPTNMQGIQALGAKITYLRRYLYMMALDIVENDIVDATLDETTRNAPAEKKMATERQIEMIKNLYDTQNITKMLEFYQINDLSELDIVQASDVIARKKKSTYQDD